MKTVQDLVPAYGDYLRFERQLSQQTVYAYLSDARALSAHLQKPVASITRNDLREYMAHLGRQGYATSTIRRAFWSFGTLWTWLYLEGHVSEIITQHLTLPRPKVTAPEWLTEEELHRLLRAKVEFHDHLAWKTMAWLGLRPGEVRALRVQDVQHDVVVVRNTKSRRDRVLPLPLQLQQDFCQFMLGTGRADYIFGHGGRWQRRHMSAAFKRTCEAADLGGRGLTPKVLRHTFATHLALRGVPGHVLQAFLGHRDLSTTQVYLHIAPASLRTALELHVLAGGDHENA